MCCREPKASSAGLQIEALRTSVALSIKLTNKAWAKYRLRACSSAEFQAFRSKNGPMESSDGQMRWKAITEKEDGRKIEQERKEFREERFSIDDPEKRKRF